MIINKAYTLINFVNLLLFDFFIFFNISQIFNIITIYPNLSISRSINKYKVYIIEIL